MVSKNFMQTTSKLWRCCSARTTVQVLSKFEDEDSSMKAKHAVNFVNIRFKVQKVILLFDLTVSCAFAIYMGLACNLLGIHYVMSARYCKTNYRLFLATNAILCPWQNYVNVNGCIYWIGQCLESDWLLISEFLSESLEFLRDSFPSFGASRMVMKAFTSRSVSFANASVFVADCTAPFLNSFWITLDHNHSTAAMSTGWLLIKACKMPVSFSSGVCTSASYTFISITMFLFPWFDYTEGNLAAFWY